MKPIHRGYTLIELMAVIVIMGLIASAVTLGVGPSLRRARAQDAIEQICSANEAARHSGNRFDRKCVLRFDLDLSSISRLEGDQVVFQTTLPAGVNILQIRTPISRISTGRAEISFSADGISQTYSIRLETADGSRRLLFSGLTGEVKTISDDAKSDAIFAAIAPHDAARGRPSPSDDAD